MRVVLKHYIKQKQLKNTILMDPTNGESGLIIVIHQAEKFEQLGTIY